MCAAMLFLSVGCASLKPKPDAGSPPMSQQDAITLRAEQVIASSAAIADAFLLWEHENRAALPQGVTDTADNIRRQSGLWINARSFLRSYKAGNLANANRLNSILDELEQIEATATKALTEKL